MLTQWAGTRHATRNSFAIKERRSWLFATLSIEAFKIVGMCLNPERIDPHCDFVVQI